jgi:hypothetical protein
VEDDPDTSARPLADGERAEARAIAERHGFAGLALRAG